MSLPHPQLALVLGVTPTLVLPPQPSGHLFCVKHEAKTDVPTKLVHLASTG